MRVPVFFAVVFALFGLIASTSTSSSKHVNAQWKKFKMDFDRHYDTPAEETRRKKIFVKNLEEIECHNIKYKEGLVTYTKGINQFADWTPEEFERMHGNRHE